MNKFYLLALATVTGLSAGAQLKYSPSSVGKQPMRGEPISSVIQLPEDRETIYTNDFSNCADWATYNAADEGFNGFITGIDFECGAGIEPSGPAAIDPVASPTADNGFMMVDSDLFGGSTGGDWVENCWFQNVDPIDCSAYDHVSLKFYTFYRMWDGGASDGNEYCLVELSTDGVTWPDETTYEVSEAPAGTRYELWPNMGTQDPVDNPTLILFDITAGAANASTLYLRFRWKGTWGYAWMVDDVELFETPESDLTVVKAYNGDFINDYEYTSIPESQLGDLTLGAIVANYGYTAQDGTPVTFDITGPETLSTGANAVIDPSVIDTLWTDPITLGGAVGQYTLTVSVPADDFNVGDTYEKNFTVSDFVYAHNTDADLVQRGFDIDDEVAIGCTYIMNDNGYAGGVRLLFGSNTDANQEMNVYMYSIGADIQDLTYVGESGPFTVTSSMIGTGEYVTIGFWESGAVEVEAGQGYIVEVRKEENSDRLYVLANVLDEDFATVNYGPFGTGDAINWYVGWNWSPAVQLVMDPSIAVNDLAATAGLELMQNVPNPAIASTRIDYTLENATEVSLTVRDMTGRTIEVMNLGTVAAGKRSIQYNVSALSAGIYSYTLTAGTTSLTKEMIVR